MMMVIMMITTVMMRFEHVGKSRLKILTTGRFKGLGDEVPKWRLRINMG